MTMKAQLIKDLAAIYGGTSFAQDVTWMPASGVPSTVRAYVTRGGDLVLQDPGQADLATFAVQAANFPEPIPGDKFQTSDGVQWTVQPGTVPKAEQWVIPAVADRRVRA